MSPAPRPVYLLAGGRGNIPAGADPLLAPVFAESAAARPSIAYVGAASGDDRGFFRWLSGYFRKSGAGDVRLAPLASPRADREEAKAVLSGCDLVFVSGGDVEAGMAVLERSGVVPFLKELHADGKPFFGMSAGSIMLARGWAHWPDPDDDASCEEFPCLGLAPVVCDTHAEADDWEELRALLAIGGPRTGYGIPSGGALRVTPGGHVSALGKPAARLARRGPAVVDLAPLLPG